MTLPQGAMIISVPHTGTRELAYQFDLDIGSEGQHGRPAREKMDTSRVQHVHHLPKGFRCKVAIIPVRHPHSLLMSYVRRRSSVQKMEGRCMILETRILNGLADKAVLVPVDIPRLRDARLEAAGYLGTPKPWVRTGHEAGHEFVRPPTREEMRIAVSLFGFNMFGDYE